MGLTSVKLPLPTGGYSDRGEFDNIESDEALWARDIIPGETGDFITQRNGFVQINSAHPSRVVNVFPWRQIGSVAGVVQLSDGDIYTLDTGLLPVTKRMDDVSGAPAGQTLWCFEAYRNAAGAARLYGVNGTALGPMVFDGVSNFGTWAAAPNDPSVIKVWRNRMCAAGSPSFPHRVWYSDVGDPDSPATDYGNNWVDLIDANTSVFDKIVALAVAGDYLIVLKRSSTWVIYDPVTFNNRRISDVGAVDWPSVTQAMGRVWWVSAPDRLYSTDGVHVREECPQVQFVPGEWQRIANADMNRTWLAASEDELYVSQVNQDSQRELIYIPLRYKNNRKEYPAFKHMHRRTINEETSEWNPSNLSTIRDQSLSVVVSWPNTDVPYSISSTGPRSRRFVFGGYSSAASSPGRLWQPGTALSGDQILLAADTTESDTLARVLAQWVTRLPGKEMEYFERTRRINAMYRGGIRVEVKAEKTNRYIGTGFSRSRSPFTGITPDFTHDDSQAGSVSSFTPASFTRSRPEARGRSVMLRVKRPSGVTNDWLQVYSMEGVFRGGKEH
jgi:hypothetical protein